MASYKARITNIERKDDSLTINYELLRDNAVVRSSVVNIQGDNIDLGVLKGRIILELNRIKGIDEKANKLTRFNNKTFELNPDGTDIALVK